MELHVAAVGKVCFPCSSHQETAWLSLTSGLAQSHPQPCHFDRRSPAPSLADGSYGSFSTCRDTGPLFPPFSNERQFASGQSASVKPKALLWGVEDLRVLPDQLSHKDPFVRCVSSGRASCKVHWHRHLPCCDFCTAEISYLTVLWLSSLGSLEEKSSLMRESGCGRDGFTIIASTLHLG